MPYVPQSTEGDCGLACLASVLQLHGHNVSPLELSDLAPVGRDGLAAKDLLDLGRRLGLEASALRVDPSEIGTLSPSSVLLWDRSHFVVLESSDRMSVVIVDPARGKRRVPVQAAVDHFGGVFFLLIPGESFHKRRSPPSLVLRCYRTHLGGRRVLGSLVLTSVVSRLATLAIPILLGLLVASFLGAHSEFWSAITVMAAVVAAASLVGAAATRTRTRLLGRTKAEMDAALESEFLDALTTAERPLQSGAEGSFNERQVQALLTLRVLSPVGIFVAVLDLGVSTLLLGALALVSIEMAVLLLLVALCGSWLILRQREAVITASNEVAAARGETQLRLQQTSRGMEDLRPNNLAALATQWCLEAVGDEKAANTERAYLRSRADATILGLQIVGPGVLVVLSAILVHAGQSTIVGVIIMLAFAISFLQPLAAALQGVLSLSAAAPYIRQIDGGLARRRRRNPATVALVEAPRVRARGLTYIFPAAPEALLAGIDVSLYPGSLTAIVGATGSGKTTLVRLLAGALSPSDGRVEWVQGSVVTIADQYCAAGLGYVPQGARLVGATIRQCLTLGETRTNDPQIWAACDAVQIADDIRSFRLGLDNPLSVDGSGLSGGQYQRLCIARALLRQPKFLVLDEATNSLDSATESRILVHLRQSGATVVWVSHRDAVAAAADIVLSLNEGKVKMTQHPRVREGIRIGAADPPCLPRTGVVQ